MLTRENHSFAKLRFWTAVFSVVKSSINTYMMIWSDFEFVIHLACIIKTRILDIIWPCLLIIMIMTWLFSGILFICALVVSFAALALRARAANDTTRAQINNIPEKSHVISLLNNSASSSEKKGRSRLCTHWCRTHYQSFHLLHASIVQTCVVLPFIFDVVCAPWWGRAKRNYAFFSEAHFVEANTVHHYT